MAENVTGYCLDLLIHPGETLKEVLEDNKMSQKELAIRTGFTEKHISTVIKGKKGISCKFAQSLEYVLGIDASFWCNLQSEYDQEVIRFNEMNNITQEEMGILSNLKQIISYFVEKDVLREDDNNSTLIMKLRKILNVSNLTYIPQLTMQGAFRASTTSIIDPYVLCAWQKICESKMKNMNIEKSLDIELLRSYIPQIKRLMFREPNAMRAELIKIFADCGIAFNIVRHFKGAPVQGFIKRTDDEKMLLCVTLRQAFADIFWFTLFHEIGHIINGDVKSYFCDFDLKKDETERKADEFASNILINKAKMQEFLIKADFSLEAIKVFALQEEVPLFIIVGRLQKEKVIEYSKYTEVKTRYKWA